MLQCRLPVGHRGNHATDGGAGRQGRRHWLEWSDFDHSVQSVTQRDPCPVQTPEQASCWFFRGHPGAHVFAHVNGHATVPGGAAGPPSRQPGPPGSASSVVARSHLHFSPSTGDLPVEGNHGAHRLADHHGADGPDGGGGPDGPGDHGGDDRPPTSADIPYRGGRRSTDAAPPIDQVSRPGHRHGADGFRGEHGDGEFRGEPADEGAPTTDRMSVVGVNTTDVHAALLDLTAALQKLARALDPGMGPAAG
ncbi:MAG: hypothetical protein QM662_14370 [Gordonia sp. (in: high G+C Gram-positive bacteria)]